MLPICLVHTQALANDGDSSTGFNWQMLAGEQMQHRIESAHKRRNCQ